MSDQLSECGRIYSLLSQESTSFFVINCLFCNKDYGEWLDFTVHLKHVHQLEHTIQKQKLRTIEDEEGSFKKRVYLEDKTQLEIFKECYNESEEKSVNPLKERANQEPFSNALECKYNEEYLDEYLTDYKNVAIHNEKDVSEKPINTIFFRLCTTDSEIMLKFIKLLSHHPTQWDNQNLTHKDTRLDSTLQLTKQIKEYLNINISPKGTRASVLYLLRWFDREYIRYLNCQQNDFKFVCLHKEYFDKLLMFLPYQHLKPVTCDKCPKQFKSEHLLMTHKHKFHNGKIPLRCRYCGHGFIHQSSHRMHENRHIKIHVWPCKICQYQATSKSDNIKHMATHSSMHPFKCSICGLAYKTKTNLNVHLRTHSLPDYECEFCKKKFYEKYRYKRHIWQHEEQELVCGSVDNFTCEICGRRFTSNKTLTKHQLVHMQENYKIEEDSKDDFYKLTDVIVYFCGYCSLQFIYKQAYETHMQLKHNVT